MKPIIDRMQKALRYWPIHRINMNSRARMGHLMPGYWESSFIDSATDSSLLEDRIKHYPIRSK
jgi:hypothetical protein